MSVQAPRRFVVTGGPGAGKSTLIAALAARGLHCSVEAGRGVIRDQVAIGGGALPWADRAAFAELMLAWEMRSFRMSEGEPGPCLFDRGIPDVPGYLRLCGLPVPAHVRRAVDLFRYERTVFVAPPWPEIYVRDAERRQDFAEAERTCAVIAETYRGCGYDPIDLPLASVEERVAFVLGHVGPP